MSPALLALVAALAGSLDDADAALAAGDAEQCGKLAQEALAQGELDEAGVVRGWLLRGRCFTLAGDADRAERSYAVALRVNAQSVVDDEAFRRARAALPSALAPLAFRAAGADADTVEVELLGDDLLLVKGARLLRDDGEEVARFPLEAGHAKHRVSGVGVAGLVAVLTDKHGNALARLPVAPLEIVLTPAPATAASTPSGRVPTMLTTLGATAIGAGLVGVVASGIGLASLGPTALGEEGQVWLVGVGASTGLFLVGAGMVVVDQGLGS